MRIYNLQQDTTMTDKVKLTWQYSRVPTSTSSVKFKVMRMSTRYDYKVRVTIGDYEFESDRISAGLLSGSQVKTFEATKGVHEGTVRPKASWV